MITIRYYVDGKYMGWEKFRYANWLHYENWVRSGNTLKIGSILITTLDELKVQR